ncbi:MAG: hypothetical protein ABSC49_00035 [Candidatus Microgenomates bacterium]|jgi:hypothetical protein
MSCELLDYARAVAGEAELNCHEVCDRTETCPLVGDDKYFPKTSVIEESEEKDIDPQKPLLKDILQLMVEREGVTRK